MKLSFLFRLSLLLVFLHGSIMKAEQTLKVAAFPAVDLIIKESLAEW